MLSVFAIEICFGELNAVLILVGDGGLVEVVVVVSLDGHQHRLGAKRA